MSMQKKHLLFEVQQVVNLQWRGSSLGHSEVPQQVLPPASRPLLVARLVVSFKSNPNHKKTLTVYCFDRTVMLPFSKNILSCVYLSTFFSFFKIMPSFQKRRILFPLYPPANSIKVELYSDEEPGRGTDEDRGDHREEGGPEQGGDVGGGYRELTHAESMTTGATRLPNGKLKCDICGMICIGPNVLMVHKRSHTGDLIWIACATQNKRRTLQWDSVKHIVGFNSSLYKSVFNYTAVRLAYIVSILSLLLQWMNVLFVCYRQFVCMFHKK